MGTDRDRSNRERGTHPHGELRQRVSEACGGDGQRAATASSKATLSRSFWGRAWLPIPLLATAIVRHEAGLPGAYSSHRLAATHELLFVVPQVLARGFLTGAQPLAGGPGLLWVGSGTMIWVIAGVDDSPLCARVCGEIVRPVVFPAVEGTAC